MKNLGSKILENDSLNYRVSTLCFHTQKLDELSTVTVQLTSTTEHSESALCCVCKNHHCRILKSNY